MNSRWNLCRCGFGNEKTANIELQQFSALQTAYHPAFDGSGDALQLEAKMILHFAMYPVIE